VNGLGHEHDGPALAGRNLAELADRLRLSVGDGSGSAGAWHNRFAAAARCWRQVAVESGSDACLDLGAALDSLAGALAETAVLSADDRLALTRADAVLEGLLERRDAEGDAVLADRAAWLAVTAEAAAVPPAAPGPAGLIVLLVASPFLRATLASRLEGAGRPVLAVREAADVPALLAQAGAPALVLADNEEPTNHLRSVRRLLAGRPGPAPALVLVASAAEPANGRERRARAVGADAVWPEPWRPEALPAGRPC
jgi:CheY-like chemotaxis protein